MLDPSVKLRLWDFVLQNRLALETYPRDACERLRQRYSNYLLGGYTGYPLPFLPSRNPPRIEDSIPSCYPKGLLDAILTTIQNNSKSSAWLASYVKMMDSRVRGETAEFLIQRTRECNVTREIFTRSSLKVSLESFLQLVQTFRRAIGGEGISKGGNGEGGFAWPGGGDCEKEYGFSKGEINSPFRSWFGVGSSFLENWRDVLVHGRAVRFEIQSVESKFVI